MRQIDRLDRQIHQIDRQIHQIDRLDQIDGQIRQIDGQIRQIGRLDREIDQINIVCVYACTRARAHARTQTHITRAISSSSANCTILLRDAECSRYNGLFSANFFLRFHGKHIKIKQCGPIRKIQPSLNRFSRNSNIYPNGTINVQSRTAVYLRL